MEAFIPLLMVGVENTFDQPVAINNTPFEIDKLEARIGLSLPFDLQMDAR